MKAAARVAHLFRLGCVAAFILASASLHGQTIDLFVMAGQSNMQGWAGDAAGYPADSDGLDRRIRFWWVAPNQGSSKERWVTLMPQRGRFPKGYFGPEIAFGRALAGAGFNPAIFKYSSSATSLARHWLGPGEGGLYDKMISSLRIAIAQLEAEGHVVRVRAFVWVQGESDAESDAMANAYFERLRVLLADLRNNVAKDPRIIMLLGVDEQHRWLLERPIVAESQRKLATMNPRTAFVSMIGLPKADKTHLTPQGLVAHGRRLADAFFAIAP